MSHKSSADFSPNFIRTSWSNLDSTNRKSSSDRVPTKESRSSFFESSERVQGDPKTNNNATPNLFTKQFRSQNSFRKLAASSTLGDLNLSPNFSSSSNRAPLRLQASVDCYPASRSQTRPRAPTISSLGRSSSVRASAENDFNAANAYTDFYPHKRKTSFKTHPKSFKTQSQTSLSSYSQKGALRYSNSGGRNSIDLTNPTKQVSILKPNLKHANTIASLTYETAELLGTPNMNRFWEPQAENSELPKKPMFAGHIRKLKSSVRHFIQPTENRLALKLFGSKKAVLKERKRCEEEAPWIIHPYSTFRFLWDFIMLMLLIINLVVLPVAIAFFNEENSHSWAVFNCVNDSIFILDILLNFRTGIPRQHMAVQVVLEPKVIRASYMRGWFGIDLISSMPMDYIFLIISQGDSGGPQILNASRTLKMLRLMKFLSLMRLLRVSRLMRYATQWEDVFNLASAAIRILNLIFMMVLISHWNGCLMFLFPRIYDFPPDSWVVIDGLKDSEWEEQYSWALFRAMSHMLCIGYGQQPPTSLMDLWLVMVSMLSGATCYALFIGHATNMIQQFDSSRRQYTEKMKQVEEYMGHRKLRPDLQVRVHEYYEYKYKGKMFDEEVILEELNDCLREEILNYNCRELVNVVPFFQGADPLFVSGVVSKLKFEVFQPGDLILSEGSFGTKMYFIQQGTVDVLSMDDDVIAQLTDGAYFGEICLLTKCRRTASIRAESYCNLYSLEVEDFNDVVREFPEVRDKMEQVARLRLTQLGRKPSQVFLKSKFKPHSLINSLILNTHSNMRSHDNNNNNNNSDNDNSDGETHDVHINDELVSNVARLTMRKLSVLLESTHPSGCSPTRTNNSSGHSSAAGTHANNNNNTISPKLAKSPKQGNHFTCHAKVDHCDTILESECGSGEQMSQSLISSHRHSNAADHTDQEVEGGRSSQVGAKMYSGTAYADNGFDDTICEDPIDDDDIDIDLDFGNAENFDDFCDDADDDENTEADVISDAVIREMKSMLNSGGQVNDSSAPNTHEQTEDLDDQNKNTVDEYSQFHLSPSCPTFLGIRQQSTDSSNI